MTTEYRYDVFLSYSASDESVVEIVAQRLTNDGVKIWFAKSSNRHSTIISKLDEALESSRRLLLFMSPTSVKSEWVNLERAAVQHSDPLNVRGRLVPILIEDCQIPKTLIDIPYIDYKERTDTEYQRILFAARSFEDIVDQHQHKLGEGPLAEAILETLSVKPNQGLDRAMLELRNSLVELYGEYESWPDSLKAALDRSKEPGVAIFLGDVRSMEGESEVGVELYKRAEEAATVDSGTYALARVRQATNLERLKRWDEALEVIEDLCTEIATVDECMDDFWWARYQQGICFKGMCLYTDARRVFEQVREAAEPRNRHKTLALYQTGTIHLYLGDLAKAEKIFIECKKLMPRERWRHRAAFPHRGLGQSYVRLGRLDEAREELRQALLIANGFHDFRYREKILENLAEAYLPALLGRGEDDGRWLADFRAQFSLEARHLRRVFVEAKRRGHHYLEVIDSDTGRETGELVTRSAAHESGRWHTTVSVILTDRVNGRPYMLLRQRTSDPSAGRWDLSASGHKIVGETDADAAARKLEDELGLYIASSGLALFEKERGFIKKGGGAERDLHETSTRFVYPCEAVNNERISIFLHRVTKEEKVEISARSRAPFWWVDIEEVFCDAGERPERYSSSVRQLSHPRLLSLLRRRIDSQR